MIIKEAVFAKKRKTVNVRVSDEVNGCDFCRRKIPDENLHLPVQVFNQDQDRTLPSTQMDFCSWKCILKYLPKIKSNYFVCLPYLHFDNSMGAGCNAADFLNLIKNIRHDKK